MTAGGQRVVGIVVAAGASTRMGGGDKAWADLGGRPLLAHALAMFAESEVDAIVVAAPPEREAALLALASEVTAPVRRVDGGHRRQDSVAAAIAAEPEAAWYLVHDAARPLASPALARRVLAAARRHGAAVPGVPVTDTIKRVNAEGLVAGTVHREPLRAVQTPQAFAGGLLRRAHREVTADVTDDAAMIEWLDAPIALVPGEPENIKVTTPADLVLVRALYAARHV